MIKNYFALTLTGLILLLTMPSAVYAVTPPDFPSCLNPQGDIKASYDDGTHGIVGTNQTYTGEDTVYSLADGNLTQCFCSDKGDGIQTNWWKISSLTENELQILKNEGWYFVPNGALWGLEDTEYMAKNATYSCRADGGDNGSVGGTSDSRHSGGSVLGTSAGDVRGLASTGNIRFILTIFMLGLVSLYAGLSIKKSIS